MTNKIEETIDLWIDEFNNCWSKIHYSKKQAIKHSKGLSNCYNCYNCRNCSDCSYCSYCSYCINCSDCRNCSDCSYCSYCSYCINCSDCSYCSYCSYCINCSDCRNCRNFKTNPQIFRSKKMGSRNDHTTVYWTDNQVQIICGCFKGDIKAFKEAVDEKYRNVPDHDYFKLIKTIEQLIQG